MSKPKPGRLISIDPSLTCSGWALFSVSDNYLLGVGKLRAGSASQTLAHRLRVFQAEADSIFENIQLNENDVLICEAATTMLDPSAAMKVEQIRGIFETLARSRNVLVPGRIHPRSVQYELLGMKGEQLERTQVKFAAVNVALHLYKGDFLRLGLIDNKSDHVGQLSKHQDIVDAVLIGDLALRKIKAAGEASMALDALFEEKKRSSTKISKLIKKAS